MSGPARIRRDGSPRRLRAPGARARCCASDRRDARARRERDAGTGVARVLFAREVTDSFAAVSGVLAATTAGGLVLGPLRGRLVDRIGPSRAVLALALPSVATGGLFVLAGHDGFALGPLAALAALAGAVGVPAGAALRTVRSDTLADDEGRHTALHPDGCPAGGQLHRRSAAGRSDHRGLLGDRRGRPEPQRRTDLRNLAPGRGGPARRQPPGGGRPCGGRASGSCSLRRLDSGATFGLLDVTFSAVARGRGWNPALGLRRRKSGGRSRVRTPPPGRKPGAALPAGVPAGRRRPDSAARSRAGRDGGFWRRSPASSSPRRGFGRRSDWASSPLGRRSR